MQLGTTARSDTRKPVRGFAVLLHETDFRELILFCQSMQRLDYRAYLALLWRRMTLIRQAGLRVLGSPFLIDQHISYADRIGTPPFSPLALRAFDSFVTRTCPEAREWRGEPIEHFISALRAAEGTIGLGRAPPGLRQAPKARLAGPRVSMGRKAPDKTSCPGSVQQHASDRHPAGATCSVAYREFPSAAIRRTGSGG